MHDITIDKVLNDPDYDTIYIDASITAVTVDYINDKIKHRIMVKVPGRNKKVLVVNKFNKLTSLGQYEVNKLVNKYNIPLIKMGEPIMAVKPISPKDITTEKLKVIPSKVIEVFNDFIASNWNGYNSTFKKNKILNVLCTELDLPRETVYDKHYLDVEDIFRKEGWNVVYEQPCRGESFDAHFKFTKP